LGERRGAAVHALDGFLKLIGFNFRHPISQLSPVDDARTILHLLTHVRISL
jgi:hypothetical protein